MTAVIGIDFGTESARALVVDTRDGRVLGSGVGVYRHAVIDEQLPSTGAALGAEWALQHPGDWVTSLETCVREALASARLAPADVVGIGIDFTACTVLPVRADGTPLMQDPGFAAEPHAWPKLWKHHASQPQATRVTDVAAARGERWLPRYGGRISSEWMLPKALQVLEEAPAVFEAADLIVEGGDWVVWQLTGTFARNACAAGYKGLWHKRDGYPSDAYLRALHPGLEGFYASKGGGQGVVAPGVCVGTLTPGWAERLGLSPSTAVGAALIDAHAGVLGSGATTPGALMLILGTSTCHLVLAEQEQLVPGVAGVVEDGIVAGLFAYEAGQAAVGDSFAWFVDAMAPADVQEEAARRQVSAHEVLTARAANLRPGESGLVALDWWNGNRSTLVDAELSGLLVGATLATRPEHVYRALVESTAFGTRVITDALRAGGVPVTRIVAGGGLTRNRMLMQIYADVLGLEIEVAGASQASALGAAMLGAVAAGVEAGGHASVEAAAAAMAPAPTERYHCDPEAHLRYSALYAIYGELYDLFGRQRDLMHRLRALR
ncbi:ribulokinase [Luteitalea sp. TBR-22]|uniref:ribulokinase n=1 Tax=Luteitalea sp. TBR-22 TaxID=2802971 RepID=UPI001EF654F5|nr:ribulokinase [Luteitalea sp. TBR-22]